VYQVVGGLATVPTLVNAQWSAMTSGWTQGLASVDPGLNAGLYAAQGEYNSYNLAATPLPFFAAISMSPPPVRIAYGGNVRGFIAFNASCSQVTTQAARTSHRSLVGGVQLFTVHWHVVLSAALT
jgi:hypothetical protein